MNISTIKWTSTFFILSGILMAQFEMYPYYIFSHSVGAVGWLDLGVFNERQCCYDKFWLADTNFYHRLY